MILGLGAVAGAVPAAAESPPSDPSEVESWQRSLEGAWWTGPMLAANAETLPRGRAYTEPYLYDVISGGRHYPGSTTYLQYGLADNFTVGLLPTFAFGTERGDRGIMLGDLKLLSQLRLTHFTPAHRIPTLALVLNERLPTGRHDRLARPSQGQGSGVFATEAGLNVQHYFRLANGRLLRARLNLLMGFPGEATVRDRSVYGTAPGFRGRARPGRSTIIDVAAEYSVTQRWVLALDLVHETRGRTRIRGQAGPGLPIETTFLPSSRNFAIAPAVEYNWSGLEGVLLGVRIIPRQHNTPASITPAIAFSRGW